MNAQLLTYLDKKISSDPEYDHLDLIQLGHYVCMICEVTNLLRQCRDRGDFSAIMASKGKL
jgi:hypothetical protein